MRNARQLNDGNFPPTAGQIIKTAMRICHDTEPERYLMEFGTLRPPRWYTAMKRTKFNATRLIRAAH